MKYKITHAGLVLASKLEGTVEDIGAVEANVAPVAVPAARNHSVPASTLSRSSSVTLPARGYDFDMMDMDVVDQPDTEPQSDDDATETLPPALEPSKCVDL
jgi:hypothetical protein